MMKFLNAFICLLFVFCKAEATYIKQFYPEIEETLLKSLQKKHKVEMSDLQIDRLHIIIGGEQSGKDTLARLLSNSRLTINEKLTLSVPKEELKQEKGDFYNFPNFYHHEGQHFLTLSSSCFNTIENMFLAAEIIDRAKHKNIFITVSQNEIEQENYASLEKQFGLLKNAINKKGSFLDILMIDNVVPIVTKSDSDNNEVKEYLAKEFSQKMGGFLGNHLSKKIEQGNFGLLPNPQNKDKGKNYNDVYRVHIENILQISTENILDQMLLGDCIKQKVIEHVAFGLLPNNQTQDRQENYLAQLEKYQQAIRLQEQIMHNNQRMQKYDGYEYRNKPVEYQKIKNLSIDMENLKQAYQKHMLDNDESIQKYKKELREKNLYKELMNDQNYRKQLQKIFVSEQRHAEIYEAHIKKILSNVSEQNLEMLNDGRYGTEFLKSFYTTFYQDQGIKKQLFQFSQDAASIMTRDMEEYFYRFMQQSKTRMLEKVKERPSFASISYHNFMSRNDLGDFSDKESFFLKSLSHQYNYEIERKYEEDREQDQIFLDNLRLKVESIVFDFSMIKNGALLHPSARSLMNFMFLLDEHITDLFKKILEEKYHKFADQSYQYKEEIEYLYHNQMERAHRELERMRESTSIKSITQEGGTIQNRFVQAVVPKSAVDDPKVFGTILKDDEVTPLGSEVKIFGFRPHQEFNRYIEITQKEVLNQSNSKLCFIKQSPEQEIFDLWGIWPVSDNNYNGKDKTAKCYVKSFSKFSFIDMAENKSFQDSLLKIEPGLSYILTDQTVINKGFGEFRPGEERGPYLNLKEFRKNVKHVVLSGDDARASIDYELEDEELPKQLSFSLGEGERKVFGSGGKKDYLSMIIKINPPSRYHVLQDVVEAVDENSQPHNKQGKQCELGRDGRFHDSKVIIGKFYKQSNFSKESFEKIVGKEVFEKKGFNWYCTEDEDDFLKNLDDYDVAWVIGFQTAPMKNKNFPQRVVDFHHKGKGLMLWEDDDPKTHGTHTVEVLKYLFPMEPKIELTGNYEGKKLMAPSDNWLNLSGKFSKNHPIFRGVCNMYEGFTICYPKSSLLPKGLHSIATANNEKSNIMCKEKDSTGGRLIIDCACTKLFEDWWQSSIGTAVYVRNATCWLAAKDQSEIMDTFISLGTFLIPEKTLKDRVGKEMRFVADFKLNQGNLGTCTGYAAVSSLMYQAGSSELNPESIYLGAEATEGLFIQKAMKRIKKNGVTLHTFNKSNNQNIFWKFEDYFSLPITQGDPKNISTIEEALETHKLPIVGTVNAKSFSDYKEEFKGLLDIKPKEKLAANHAILIIGYDKNQQKIIIKNSWNDGNSIYPYNEFIKGLNCAYIGKGAKAYMQ